jgi:hypothetical protein
MGLGWNKRDKNSKKSFYGQLLDDLDLMAGVFGLEPDGEGKEKAK